MNSVKIPEYYGTDLVLKQKLTQEINDLRQQIKDLQKEIHRIKIVCGVDVAVPEWADKEEYIKEYEKMYGKIRNFKE